MKIDKLKKATRNDWKNLKPFPEKCSRIKFKRIFSEEEFEKISLGFIPKTMDDHWFAFLENKNLYYYRSWNGIAIYKVKFTKEKDLYIPEDVRLNKKGFRVIFRFFPNWLYSRLLLFLIQAELLKQHDPFPIPKIIKKVYRLVSITKNSK